MSTWDDKPNDYDHACKIIERLRAALERLIQDYEDETGQKAVAARAALQSKEGE
jgi:hypothetical protein